MKTRISTLLVMILIAGVISAAAAGTITKAQAEKDAVAAVHGGTVISAVLESNMGKLTWSVDVTSGIDVENVVCVAPVLQPIGEA